MYNSNEKLVALLSKLSEQLTFQGFGKLCCHLIGPQKLQVDRASNPYTEVWMMLKMNNKFNDEDIHFIKAFVREPGNFHDPMAINKAVLQYEGEEKMSIKSPLTSTNTVRTTTFTATRLREESSMNISSEPFLWNVGIEGCEKFVELSEQDPKQGKLLAKALSKVQQKHAKEIELLIEAAHEKVVSQQEEEHENYLRQLVKDVKVIKTKRVSEQRKKNKRKQLLDRMVDLDEDDSSEE